MQFANPQLIYLYIYIIIPYIKQRVFISISLIMCLNLLNPWQRKLLHKLKYVNVHFYQKYVMQILLLDCFECVISWLNRECFLQLLKRSDILYITWPCKLSWNLSTVDKWHNVDHKGDLTFKWKKFIIDIYIKMHIKLNTWKYVCLI